MNLMPIPQNYKNNVDWILGAYTDADVTFPNGFQKDAIQNAAGARKNSKWKEWHCDISYVMNPTGHYIVVEDSGTVGLTGKNIPGTEVNKMMSEDIKLPPEERLARFSSLFNSGGNTSGGGLYGAGKSVYSVASDEYTYYYDSLREDGKYVANVNSCGQVMEVALEDDEARKYILEKTGMTEKKTVGTRVIIVSPKAELVDSIQSGSIIPFIQESWWLIIKRLPEGAAITVNGVQVSIPSDIMAASKTFELQNPEMYSTGHKVKHFGLYVFENGSNVWSGISYYRKGMKIGKVDINSADIPKKIEGKYWGYIEVDELWEDELAEIEDKVHFGVSKGKKSKLQYQHLKNYCSEMFRANMIQWGFSKEKDDNDKKLKDELKSIAEELQDLFDRLEFEDLGKGPQKPDFDVRWQDIRYPEKNTEKVTFGDEIAFSVRIKSSYSSDKKFEYNLSVVDKDMDSVISQIDSGKITVCSNSVYKMDFVHRVTKENSRQYAENRIRLSVKAIGSAKEKTKFLPFFFDVDKPDNTTEAVDLSLHECIFPVPGSRRVNFGQSVRKVCWKIDNRRNHTLDYRLNISIHNASDSTCYKIVDIGSFTGVISPFEDVLTPNIDEILFDQKVYEPYLTEGILELRARLTANASDPIYEKGDKITTYRYKIFLNKDEKNGKSDSFEIQSANAPERYERAWRTPGNNRAITVNIGHAAYLNLSDYPDFQHEYLREQMLKQYVLLYLDEGKFDEFGEGFSELEPQEAAEKVIQKVERVFYESLK